jgi:flagellar basal-body rod modification protein FlgD
MNIQGILPAITAPLLGQSAHSTAIKSNATSGTSSTSGNGTSSSSLQETFLNLLVTELQNQDPTAPVDPTEMVGQLVSLNQLDQLISINSILGGLNNPVSSTANNVVNATGTSLPGASGVSSATVAPSPDSNAAAATALQQLEMGNARAAGASSLMNLYGSMGTPAQNPTF